MPLALGSALGAGLAFDLLQLGSAASAAKLAPARMNSRRVLFWVMAVFLVGSE
jgi:hypothetical protein